MKLDHVQLAMPPGKEDEARSFFVGIFGMYEEEKPYPLSERGGCWFRKGNVLIHVGVEKEFVPQKKAHPAIIVSNIYDIENILKENDYEVIWDETLKDRVRFYTNDPFGNRIEILKEGDGFSQR